MPVMAGVDCCTSLLYILASPGLLLFVSTAPRPQDPSPTIALSLEKRPR